MPTGVLVAAAAVLGLLVGSFLNVVASRLPRGESLVRPRSQCPVCGVAIRPVDNVPLLSYLLLHGRCRSCRTRISLRYPVVEALTGLLFAAVAWRFGAQAALPAYLYLAAVGIALSAIDIDLKRLPDKLTLPSYLVGLVLLSLAAGTSGTPMSIIRGVAGMAALFSGYYLLAVIKPGGMGFGDVKLAGVLGLYLAFLGWSALAVGTFAGFLLGGLFSIMLVVLGRGGRKTKVPYGPFMFAGALVGILAGGSIAAGYLHLMLR